MGDYPLWLYCAYKSKLHFLDECTAIYRILEESASHSKNYLPYLKFTKSTFDIREYFIKKYPTVSIEVKNYIDLAKANFSLRIALLNGQMKKRRYNHLEEYTNIH